MESSVTVESSRRSSGNEEQIEGRVEALPASPVGSFVVAGRTVTTDANTRFIFAGGTGRFLDLVIGRRVHVKGQVAGANVLASVVDIQNTNVDLPVNLNGVMTGFSGAIGGFMFTVNGREVRGDASTEFFGGSAFGDLVNDARVEVKGLQRDGYVYASRIHVNGDDTGTGTAGEFQGTLTSISGTTPPLTLVIGGRTVSVTAATELRRRGDAVTFAVLRTGMTLEVSGATSGGVFIAKKLTISESTFDVDVDGAIVGPVTGTCPAITFKVGALTVKTTGFTEFKKTACSAIAAGVAVKVRGVLLPGGTAAEATRVETK